MHGGACAARGTGGWRGILHAAARAGNDAPGSQSAMQLPRMSAERAGRRSGYIQANKPHLCQIFTKSSPHLVPVKVVPYHRKAPRAQKVPVHQLLAGLQVAGGLGRARVGVWREQEHGACFFAGHACWFVCLLACTAGVHARRAAPADAALSRVSRSSQRALGAGAGSPPPHLRRPMPTMARSSPMGKKSPPSRKPGSWISPMMGRPGGGGAGGRGRRVGAVALKPCARGPAGARGRDGQAQRVGGSGPRSRRREAKACPCE